MAFKLDYMKDELVDMYKSGMNFSQIAKSIGEYEQAVSNVIRSVLDIPKKERLSIHEDYFKEINTMDKAYFFGLIAADGAIVYNNNNTGTMTISLHQGDRHILEELKKKTKAEVTIKDYEKNNGSHTQSRFVTANQVFVEHLIAHKITPRKSMTLEDIINEVEEPFKIDFIRGYFDGNGSIFKTITSGTQERYYVSFRGNDLVLRGIKNYLPITGGKIHWAGNPNGTGQYTWTFGARKDIELFRDMIYHENIESCYLVRKHERFPW